MARAESSKGVWRRRTGVTVAILVIGAISFTLVAFTYGGLRWRNPPITRPSPAAAVSPSHEEVTFPRRDINVVLISIDTLRADHLGCYGYGPPTSPNVDRWSREAVVFEHAFSQAPSTLPSHASIFTSMLPSHHGALYSVGRPLPDRATTMAELLQAQGYETAGFHGAGQVSDEFGMGQGFDQYVAVQGRFRNVVEEAVKWLDQRSAAPFFLFLHTYEVHHPYTPDPEYLELFDSGYDGELPGHIMVDDLRRINGDASPQLEIDEADLRHIVATYDAEIRSMDDGFGQFVTALAKRGLRESTLLIFTSDHGEEFNEHGRVGWHSHSLYDELLWVPLVIRFPGGVYAGRRVDDLVRLLDVAPTVLDVLALPAAPTFEGLSVRTLFDTDTPPRVAISQQDTKYAPPVSSLRTLDWKLYEEIVVRRLYRDRLFDLRADPGEQHNVLATNLGLAWRLTARLREIEALLPAMDGRPAELSAQTIERLRALGYRE